MEKATPTALDPIVIEPVAEEAPVEMTTLREFAAGKTPHELPMVHAIRAWLGLKPREMDKPIPKHEIASAAEALK